MKGCVPHPSSRTRRRRTRPVRPGPNQVGFHNVCVRARACVCVCARARARVCMCVCVRPGPAEHRTARAPGSAGLSALPCPYPSHSQGRDRRLPGGRPPLSESFSVIRVVLRYPSRSPLSESRSPFAGSRWTPLPRSTRTGGLPRFEPEDTHTHTRARAHTHTPQQQRQACMTHA